MSIRNVEIQTIGLHIGTPDHSKVKAAQRRYKKSGILSCAGVSIFGDCGDIGGIATVTIGTADKTSTQENKKLSLHVKGNTVIKGDTQTDYGLSVSGGKDYKLYVEGNAKFEHPNIGDLNDRFNTADDRGKTFDMSHPSRDGFRLRYACIEGPEIAVYCRGRLNTGTEIQLPSYWKNLVYENSITVQITPIGTQQDIIVKEYDNEKVILESSSTIDCFYTICAERKDVNPLITEYEGKQGDYPDPNWNLGIFDENRNLHDPKYATSQNVITK
tara:strand:+ start:442 stop:1257 length:816 start_codon:yes stop_codon:yes gene_type:complete